MSPVVQLMKVSDASKQILGLSPSRVYDSIKRGVYPPGVVVFLTEKSIRFHRENLIKWIESGGNYKP